jgi:hypothetical protein
MGDLEVLCPVCENDISISAREMKLALSHKKETGGKPIVSCPECCRCLLLPEMPENGADLEQWITDVSDAVCIPMLDDEYIREPTGYSSHLGVRVYTSGAGETGLPKRTYMFKYGINPECAIAKNPNMGGKPFKIGGK